MLTINVTEEDIAAGERHCAHACPVVHAINRVVGPDHYCTVDGVRLNYYRLGTSKVINYCRLGPVIQTWIASFDGGYDVEPITFEVPGP
jgi:hypothetical protein